MTDRDRMEKYLAATASDLAAVVALDVSERMNSAPLREILICHVSLLLFIGMALAVNYPTEAAHYVKHTGTPPLPSLYSDAH